MAGRHADGSAGDANYGAIGQGYARFRRPDPRIAAYVHAALGSARTVLNVGAGTGSYEPVDRLVTAVEPSAVMRAQRPPHLPPAINAVAEHLPFADGAFEASMATVTVHQWSDLAAGLAELRRVTRGPIAIFTFDGTALDRFWLVEYAPEVLAVEARRYPPIGRIAAALGPDTSVGSIPIPLDCVDGFSEAYYGRPERLLEPDVRRAMSAWSFVDAAVGERFERTLRDDLASGAWDARHGHLRRQPEFDGSLRLIVGRPV
jgi:SAM-dependent methyltransferase